MGRPEEQIHLGILLQHLPAPLLGHAARNTKNGTGMVPFDLLHLAYFA